MRAVGCLLLLFAAGCHALSSSSTGGAAPVTPSVVLQTFSAPALNASTFVITVINHPLTVQNLVSGSGGNLTVRVSLLTAERNTTALLEGRALKSDIITFSFTPVDTSNGLQSATISMNVSEVTVASGKFLQWYKFNVAEDQWDLKGGTFNTTTGMLSYATTSFSDWSVQETDIPVTYSSSRAWYDPSMPWMPLYAWILASLGALGLLSFYFYKCGCCGHLRAKAAGYSEGKV